MGDLDLLNYHLIFLHKYHKSNQKDKHVLSFTAVDLAQNTKMLLFMLQDSDSLVSIKETKLHILQIPFTGKFWALKSSSLSIKCLMPLNNWKDTTSAIPNVAQMWRECVLNCILTISHQPILKKYIEFHGYMIMISIYNHIFQFLK